MASSDARDEVLRFEDAERHLHWAVAIPFMVCFATAVVLVTVYNPHPTRPLRQLVSWTHRLSGVCLGAMPLWIVARHRRRFGVYCRNIREAFVWTVDDFKWLFLMGPATFVKKVRLPDQGKFNAAEKINFVVLVSTYPLYLVTGVTLWLPGIALLAWQIHFSMALVAAPLILGHIFMATLNPDTKVGLNGMITGFVDRHWAQHHYARWYRERHGAAEPPVSSGPDAGAGGSPQCPPAGLGLSGAGPDAATASDPFVAISSTLDVESGSLA